jgi:hypothetical protein
MAEAAKFLAEEGAEAMAEAAKFLAKEDASATCRPHNRTEKLRTSKNFSRENSHCCMWQNRSNKLLISLLRTKKKCSTAAYLLFKVNFRAALFVESSPPSGIWRFHHESSQMHFHRRLFEENRCNRPRYLKCPRIPTAARRKL